MDKKLSIAQAVVSINVIRVDGKSLTLAVFKQIPESQATYVYEGINEDYLVILEYVVQPYDQIDYVKCAEFSATRYVGGVCYKERETKILNSKILLLVADGELMKLPLDGWDHKHWMTNGDFLDRKGHLSDLELKQLYIAT